ncbi:MAG TPA: RecQ family ATP-dependent DNA helicase [Actinomycetota bacterium]|nr:RecQ family ATP-dependent DNA helicase [Actinomycetota bacterium]
MVGSAATFREHQLEAIEELVVHRRRVLLVERTGFGKSAVYFIATKLLRQQGAGTTILISPLLVLMRNQVEMARSLDLHAATINSSNTAEWPAISNALDKDRVDLLLISPERLNNERFRRDHLRNLAAATGLLVIDEIHCISDWGHDFRPDYRRLSRVLGMLPPGVPVLGTTATANNRVVQDVEEQLGRGTITFRGSLDRDSLILGVKRLSAASERLAYLAALVPTLPGSGIVYCLTIDDAKVVAAWLQSCGIPSVAYSGETDSAERLDIERRLIDSEVKVVAATSALGMGFDKPDLGFVIHYQSPGTPIAYYQQVGRAGRGVDKAYCLLLRGNEDRDIQDYFIESAFPSKERAEEVVALLERTSRPLSVVRIMQHVNVRRSRLEAMLKILEVEGAVERSGGKWRRTLTRWVYDDDRVSRVTAARRDEQAAMEEYVHTDRCRMLFLREQLDDPGATECGRCDNCGDVPEFDVTPEPAAIRAATEHLRSVDLRIEPRKQWPGLSREDLRGKIPENRRLEPGRVLSLYGDAGWGTLVKRGKWEEGHFDDALIAASAEVVATRWRPEPFPEWVTCIPSTRHPGLVPEFARSLADRLGLRFEEVVEKTRPSAPQKEMENSPKQLLNVWGAFEVTTQLEGPGLLVDDMVDSGWTLTVVGFLLKAAGASHVYPFALARTTGK